MTDITTTEQKLKLLKRIIKYNDSEEIHGVQITPNDAKIILDVYNNLNVHNGNEFISTPMSSILEKAKKIMWGKY